MFASKRFRLASLFATLVMAVTLVSVDTAEARRGGSFGGRGTRTFNSAPATNTSPNITAPVQRTTTTPSQQQSGTTAQNRAPQSNPFGFSGLMRGLMFGGLLGLMFGGGFGGFGGVLAMLAQVLIFGFIAAWLFRRFARPSMAAAGGPVHRSGGNDGAAGLGGMGGSTGRTAQPRQRQRNPDELRVGDADLNRFERMLTEVQTAYGAEDYATLRRLTTPEMMGYLAEELGENASRGVKNEVSQVKLLQGDISESWREGPVEYATTAMRYQSIDVTRDRTTGAVVDGQANAVTETIELWTFMRERGGDWKLSAIQEA